MKRITVVFLFFLQSTFLLAQSYSRSWQKVREAIDKDLPQTALREVQKIERMAVSEGLFGQQLQCSFVRSSLLAHLSQDSVRAFSDDLKRRIGEEHIQARKSVLNLLLARIKRSPLMGRDAESDTIIILLQESLKDLHALYEAPIADYLPAFVEGEDGNVYKHRLLDPVAKEVFSLLSELRYDARQGCQAINLLRKAEGEITRLYLEKGNIPAYLRQTLDSLQREGVPSLTRDDYCGNGEFCLLQRMLETPAPNEVLVDVYKRMADILLANDLRREGYEWLSRGVSRCGKEKRSDVLRNQLRELEQPFYNMRFSSDVYYPGQEIRTHITAQNLTALDVSLYLLAMDASEARLLKEKIFQSLLKRIKRPSYVFRKSLFPVVTYCPFDDSLSFRVDKPGVYLVAVRSGGLSPEFGLLYVSSVRSLHLSLPCGGLRLVALDAHTGKPLDKAQFKVCDEKGTFLCLLPSKGGKVYLDGKDFREKTHYYYAQIKGDTYSPALGNRNGFRIHSLRRQYPEQTKMLASSDRGIYRPGDSVQVAVVRYKQKQDVTYVIDYDTCRFSLLDANGHEIAKIETTCDDFGSARVSFLLPKNVLSGLFRVNVNGSYATSFRVEEYKRPTFRVLLDEVKDVFHLGDTLRLSGQAKSFTEVGVQGAVVDYRVSRSGNWWQRSRDRDVEIFRGRSVTDLKGTFSCILPLREDEDSRQFRVAYRYTIDVEVQAPDGEKESQQLSLCVGQEPLQLSIEGSRQYDKSRKPALTLRLLNAAGENVARVGEYVVSKDRKEFLRTSFRSNEPLSLTECDSWPSGVYRLTARIGSETDTLAFASCDLSLFSPQDTRPCDAQSLGWFYAPDKVLHKDGPTILQVGSARDSVTLLYDLFCGDTCLESKTFHFSDSILTFSYQYDASFGDGLTALFAFMKNGELFQRTIQLRKEQPDKKLRFCWKSFRDKLHPGEQESWRLRVLAPDGSPASAQVLATLYDASLDKYQALRSWGSLSFARYLPYFNWNTRHGSLFFSKYAPLHFAHILDHHFDALSAYWLGGIRTFGAKTKGVNVRPRMLKGASASVLFATAREVPQESNDMDIVAMKDALSPQESVGSASILRSNFAETAFFYPQLCTDAEGELSLSFTLPESLTAWHLRLMAHTKVMDVGELDTLIIARKDFQVTANMPRFLRVGDETFLSVTVRNLTGNEVTGKLSCELLSQEGKKLLQRFSLPFAAQEGNENMLNFPFTAPDGFPFLICRFVAETDSFSDGEQHLLPILSNKTYATESLPFVLSGKGTFTIPLGEKFPGASKNKTSSRTFSVEYEGSPMWCALQAFPILGKVSCENAINLSASGYVASLAAAISQKYPNVVRMARERTEKIVRNKNAGSPLLRDADLKGLSLDETPWRDEAERERMRAITLENMLDSVKAIHERDNVLQRLSLLQQSDGSWSWFPGMKGSTFVTLHVANMLSLALRAYPCPSADSMLQRSFHYISIWMEDRVREMKKTEARDGVKISVDDDVLVYLSLAPCKKDKLQAGDKETIHYLQRKVYDYSLTAPLQQKARCVPLLVASGQGKAAFRAAESLLEHTVMRDGIGRYFDNSGMGGMTNSRRLALHLVTMQALMSLQKEDTTALNEMLMWLVLNKRTCDWTEPISSVNAIHTLLLCEEKMWGRSMLSSGENGKDLLSLQWTRESESQLLDASGWMSSFGFFRKDTILQSQDPLPVSLRVNKTVPQMTWGSVSCSYETDGKKVHRSSNGLSVHRSLLREREGKWVAVRNGEMLKRGENVRIRYDITADRDYDYVCVRDATPAHLEPVALRSGYRWNGSLGYYHVMGDTKNRYFLEHCTKGLQRIEEPFYVARSGCYQSGTVTVQCCYAPEFIGMEAAFTSSSM